MLRKGEILDRIDGVGRQIPLTAAVPLVGLYLVTMTLWAAGFEPAGPASLLVFAPAWAPVFAAHLVSPDTAAED